MERDFYLPLVWEKRSFLTPLRTLLGDMLSTPAGHAQRSRQPMEAAGSQPAPRGIKQTLKKLRGKMERNWGPGYIAERLDQAVPEVIPTTGFFN